MSNPGAANSTPWNDAPGSFPPNTNTLDRNAMPSEKAEAARLKSAAVMAALKNGKEEEANRLMGKAESGQGLYLPTGAMSRLKEKIVGKKRNETVGDDASVRSEGVERETVVIGGDAKGRK